MFDSEEHFPRFQICLLTTSIQETKAAGSVTTLALRKTFIVHQSWTVHSCIPAGLSSHNGSERGKEVRSMKIM